MKPILNADDHGRENETRNRLAKTPAVALWARNLKLSGPKNWRQKPGAAGGNTGTQKSDLIRTKGQQRSPNSSGPKARSKSRGNQK